MKLTESASSILKEKESHLRYIRIYSHTHTCRNLRSTAVSVSMSDIEEKPTQRGHRLPLVQHATRGVKFVNNSFFEGHGDTSCRHTSCVWTLIKISLYVFLFIILESLFGIKNIWRGKKKTPAYRYSYT